MVFIHKVWYDNSGVAMIEFNEETMAIGVYEFMALDAKRAMRMPEHDHVVKNVVTQGFFTAVFRFLNQAISSPDIAELNLTHFATGTGTATPMKADTALGAEYFRKGISVKSFGLTSFVCKTVIGPTESNIVIKEVGLFANGSSTPGSGTLISHCPTNIDKNANIQYIVTYTLTLI